MSHKKFQSRFAYCVVTQCQISYIETLKEKSKFSCIPKCIVVGLLMVERLFSLLFYCDCVFGEIQFSRYIGGREGVRQWG